MDSVEEMLVCSTPSRKEYVSAINIAESRLELGDDSGLSGRGRIIYLLLRGDNYFGVLNSLSSSSTHIEEFSNRVISSYEEAMREMNSENITVSDPLRLMGVFSLCRALWRVRGDKVRAKELACEAFNASTAHTIECIDDISLDLLQRLRDHYMEYEGTSRGVVVADSDTGTEDEEKGRKDTKLPSSPDGEAVKESGSRSSSDKDAAEKQLMHRQTSSRKSADSGDSSENISLSDHAVSMVASLRRKVYSLGFCRLEDLPSAGRSAVALNAIFKTYVKGHALPGLVVNSESINVGGTKTSFDKFLLQGPYLSWKGFAAILRDFGIAKPPLKTNALGQRFPEGLWDGAIVGSSQSPPLDMEQATGIFIQSSTCGRPALMVKKFENRYKEIAEQLDVDPWIVVGRWIDSLDWQIMQGLNFGQFCDCMAKCGAAVFSSRIFDEALPEFIDKVDHFFTAMMKLNDENYWTQRISKRNKETLERSQSRQSIFKSTLAASSSAPNLSAASGSGNSKGGDPSPQQTIKKTMSRSGSSSTLVA